MKSFVKSYFTPSANDVAYTYGLPFKIALIFRMDSYKFGHPFAGRPDVVGMSAYGCARVEPTQVMIPHGLQRMLKKDWTEAISYEDVEQARDFALAHFGYPLFAYDDWIKVVEEHNGLPPLIIRAVPEGTPVKGGDAMYSVTCLDADLAWMAAGFETEVLRGVWYPTTIATDDYEIWNDVKGYYTRTGCDLAAARYALHDFGGRGVTCGEQAEIGGGAHTLNFLGSDTVEGILSIGHYYKHKMAAFSVYATEHSIECQFGLDAEGEKNYLRHQLAIAKSLGATIVSLVIDGKDVKRCAQVLCSPEFVDIIKNCGMKVVFRPDSGDMMEIVPYILRLQQDAYGYDLTSTGHRLTRYVGIIQGDGVDHSAIRTLLGWLEVHGYAAACAVFGSGGALLQKVNRDKYKFAQKCSAVLLKDGTWFGTAKDPITDPGKKSLEGVITLVRNCQTGETRNMDISQGFDDGEWEDMHQLVYHCGVLYNETTLTEMRARMGWEG